MDEMEPRDEFSSSSAPGNQGLKVAVVILVIAVCIGFGWAYVAHRNAEQLAASRDELRASLSQTRGEIDNLSAKLSSKSASAAATQTKPFTETEPAQTAEQTAAQSAAQGTESTPAPSAHVKNHRATVKHAKAKRKPAEDKRWKEIQAQLAEHQKQIQANQDNLQKTRSELESSLSSTRDELNGSIAKNHDELVALEKKGERNFFEFDISRSKQFKNAGPLSISLRKANSKHEFCDLAMIVNDSEMSKKHVNLYEPVLFYPEGYTQPLELVINKINKSSVHGYVSAPKYQQPAQSANTTNPSNNNSSSGSSGNSGGESANLQHRSGDTQ
jgi:hypothetical protein